jgi:hypothetical protein
MHVSVSQSIKKKVLSSYIHASNRPFSVWLLSLFWSNWRKLFILMFSYLIFGHMKYIASSFLNKWKQPKVKHAYFILCVLIFKHIISFKMEWVYKKATFLVFFLHLIIESKVSRPSGKTERVIWGKHDCFQGIQCALWSA